ncbi:MAG: ATP-binding cassette domain-containing protein [Lachnospiraceae bacterium]|nr:ATP-binding cassette domain-containing protein [Lachnospiraceae bacterium]
MRIEIHNLSKQYGDKIALQQFNIKLEEGVYALLGPNGAGKSTLINLLTDSICRSQGEILCDGKEILSLGKEYRRMVGYMPQQQRMYDNYTAVEFLKYMAAIKGIHGKTARGQIEHLLKVVNLWDVKKKKIGGYSGGMKQRVMLAQALLGNPKILILDEPTAGLDPSERINIRNYIAQLSEEMIILFATHVVSDIECIAREVLLMKQGQLVKTGSPIELIASVQGKVGEIDCELEQLEELQKKYCSGNVSQRLDGLKLRIVGDTLPDKAKKITDHIDLEDVYMYYINYPDFATKMINGD